MNEENPSRESHSKGSRGAKNLWIVNQYALALHQPGITRHAMLAQALRALDWDTVIFSSAAHYWNLPREDSLSARVEFLPEATFVRIRTAGHVTNGARRIVSMILFSIRALLYGMRRGKLGIKKPSVVVGSTPHPFGACTAYLLSKIYRVPFVLEVRDLWPDSLIHLLGIRDSHPLIRILRKLEIFLYRRSSAIIAVLPGIEDHVRSIVPDAPCVQWVPNGVDLSTLPVVGPSQEGEGFTVLYAGAHGVPNALDTLLRAAQIMQDRESHLAPSERTRFVLVGDGKEKRNLVALAQKMHLHNMEFMPAVPKTDVPALLASADILAITWLDVPLYRFGVSPNKLFDYFAAGRPVVMALSSRYDPVTDAGAGINVPAEDADAYAAALLRLRRMTRTERARMGTNGRRYVERHHDMRQLAYRYACILETAESGLAEQAGSRATTDMNW